MSLACLFILVGVSLPSRAAAGGRGGVDDVSSETRMREMSNKPRSKKEELGCYNVFKGVFVCVRVLCAHWFVSNVMGI